MSLTQNKKKIVVIGSGPIRIGQGIEFDYCSVHCVWALREAGYEAVIINNNPETVSTDFDTSDRLYFEPLTAEDALNIPAFCFPFYFARNASARCRTSESAARSASLFSRRPAHCNSSYVRVAGGVSASSAA